MIRQSKPRWSHGTLVLDGSVVGVVEPDAFNRGWWAYGCEEDWQDTKLGLHDTERKAQKAVADWVKEYAQ